MHLQRSIDDLEDIQLFLIEAELDEELRVAKFAARAGETASVSPGTGWRGTPRVAQSGGSHLEPKHRDLSALQKLRKRETGTVTMGTTTRNEPLPSKKAPEPLQKKSSFSLSNRAFSKGDASQKPTGLQAAAGKR